ncbi:MAG: hypothetical protein FWE78_06090 [Methanimicrococcus sp.]|nr:hypothetical protein [Methanimicrococcus sp.]
MKFNDDEKFLFQEKTSSALVFIYRKEVTYISEVASNIDSTFSHTNKIIKKLSEIGLLSSVFEGRSRFLQLTPRGYYFAKNLSEAVEIFNSDEEFEFPDGYIPTRQEEILPETSENQDSVFMPAPSVPSASSAPSSTSASPDMNSPVTLAGQIQLFSIRIKEIYENLTESGAHDEILLRNLGPYDRELKIIAREIEKLDPANETTADVMSAYRAAKMQYSFYLGKG